MELQYAYAAIIIGLFASLPTVFRLFNAVGRLLVIKFYPFSSITFVIEENGHEIKKTVKVSNDSELIKAIMEAKRVCDK